MTRSPFRDPVFYLTVVLGLLLVVAATECSYSVIRSRACAQTAPSVTTIPAALEMPSVQLPVTGEILALDQGDRAPHAGMLVLDDDLVAWRQAIERLTYELTATRSLDAQTCTLRLHEETMRTTAAEERLTLHEGLWHDRTSELAASLTEARSREGPRWFENPLLWTVIGALLGGAVVGLIAGALR